MRQVLFGAAIAMVAAAAAQAQAPAPALSGTWTLDRSASQFPKEIGFGINWATTGTTDIPGGKSEASSPGRNIAAPRESSEDALRLRVLTSEVRNPPDQITISGTPDAITIAGGETKRTFHPTGRQEVVGQLQGDVPVVATSRLEGDRLTVLIDVEEGRQLRYTYVLSSTPRQLTIDVQFLERGKGDTVRRVYNAPSAPPPVAQNTASSKPSPGAPAGAAPANTQPAAAQRSTEPKADLRPGAEFRGISRLGVVVEDLGSQATSCGLTKDAIDKAVSKSLTDGGFQIVRNTDEDTYLYVNVSAASAGNTCFSRYDATLYTHTTATLPYTTSPVLVQVELLHKGGIAGGPPAQNAQSVIGGLTQFVNGFVTRIKESGK